MKFYQSWIGILEDTHLSLHWDQDAVFKGILIEMLKE